MPSKPVGGGWVPNPGAVVESLRRSADFRRDTAKFLADAFPDTQFSIPTELGGMDTFAVGAEPTLFNPTPGQGGRPHEPASLNPLKGGQPFRGMSNPRETSYLSDGAFADGAGRVVTESHGRYVPPAGAGGDAFDRYVELGAENRVFERVRGHEESLHDSAYYDYHLLENFWRVKDDERFVDERAARERNEDARAEERRSDERRSDESRYSRMVEDRAMDEMMRERELMDRMSYDLEEERAALEREREYRDEMRWDEEE